MHRHRFTLSLFVLAGWVASVVGQPDTLQVLVPKADIPAGTKLDASMFVTKTYAKDAVSDKSIQHERDLQGHVPWRLLRANLPVTNADLHGFGSFMRHLELGYRAVTFRIQQEDSIPVNLLPGMHVDVLTIGKGKEAADGKIILQNIRLLAVNDVFDSRAQARIARPTSITLMMTPEQAQQFFGARIRGAIGLALRKPGDNEQIEVPR